MKMYSMKTTKETNEIYENETNVRLVSIKDKQKAQKYCRFLNAGGAFAGFTPQFFTTSVQKYIKNV